jgi:uncharacterized membrane protein
MALVSPSAVKHRPVNSSTRWFRARVWLASAMWAPVLLANAGAVALGILLPLLDEILGDRPRLPIALSSEEQVLGALAGGMITFTGIVFSAVFVAAQIQTSSYSPRLAARLRRDRVIIAGLASPPPPPPTRCSRWPRLDGRPIRTRRTWPLH